MPDLGSRLRAALAPRYRLSHEIAAGGMGTIFLGHDPVLDRDVAIKLLRPEAATAVAVERFIRESRILARLSHPNIVPILEARHDGDLLWFVMPLMSGSTLAAAIAKGPLPVDRLLVVATDLLDALGHAHGGGVIHRDIKPSNIFLQDGHAVLADFGVAGLVADDGDTLTAGSDVVGTLRYMSPEQKAGVAATPMSDIYAVGATLYEAATGMRWSGDHSAAAWRAVPRTWRAALRRALHAEPSRRWHDAAAFRRALTSGKRRSVAMLIGSASLGVAVLASIALRNSPEAGPSPTPTTVSGALVVLPFTGTDSASVSDVMRYAAHELGWFLPLEAMTWHDANDLGPEMARLRAAAHVTGRVEIDSTGIGVALIEVKNRNGTAMHDFVVRGKRADPVGWGRLIADSVVSRLHPTAAVDFRRLPGTSRSMEAEQAFHDGQVLFLQGDGEGADSMYRTALAVDSAFVRARWFHVLARQWLRKPYKDELKALAERPEQLPYPLAELVRVQLEPDLHQRLDGFERLGAEAPKYATLRQLRANELFSRGPLVGRPLREGVESLRAVAHSLSATDRVDALTHVVWGALRLGDRALADSALRARRAIQRDGDPYGDFLRLLRAGRFGSWTSWVLREVALRRAPDELAGVVRMGLQFDTPFDQLAIARRLAASTDDPRRKVSMLSAEATALLAMGRPLAALERLDRAARIFPDDQLLMLQAAEWRLMLPALGIVLPPDAVSQGRADAGRTRHAHPARSSFALAVDGLQRRDTAVVRTHRAALAGLAPTDSLAAELSTYLDALAHGHAGRYTQALDVAQRIRVELVSDDLPAHGSMTRALLYLRRAEWYEASGRPANALQELLWHENNDLRGWPDGMIQTGEVDAAMSGIAAVRRVDLLTGTSDRQDGCPLIRRAIEVWSTAEPSFQPWLERARRIEQTCR